MTTRQETLPIVDAPYVLVYHTEAGRHEVPVASPDDARGIIMRADPRYIIVNAEKTDQQRVARLIRWDVYNVLGVVYFS